MGSVTYSSPGTYSWQCPQGVTLIKVMCWGGGGAIQGGSPIFNYGGSGGNGQVIISWIDPIVFKPRIIII